MRVAMEPAVYRREHPSCTTTTTTTGVPGWLSRNGARRL